MTGVHRKPVHLSIVIPFFRDIEAVNHCLTSIERACGFLPPDTTTPEIIVIDDHSPVPFDGGHRTVPVRCYRLEKNKGVGAARNRGARLAQGTHILFVDSDVMLDENHLARLFTHLSYDRGPIVQGPSSIIPANRPASKFHHYMALAWNYHQNANWRISIFTQCFAIEKDFFNRLGGFSERYARSGGEEFELGLRLARNTTGSIVFDRDLVHFHHSENLIKRLKKVYFRSRHIRKIALSMPNLPFRFTAQSLLRSCFAFILNLSLMACLVDPLAGSGMYLLFAGLFYVADDSFSRQMRDHHSLGLSVLSIAFRQMEYSLINLGMLRALISRDNDDQ